MCAAGAPCAPRAPCARCRPRTSAELVRAGVAPQSLEDAAALLALAAGGSGDELKRRFPARPWELGPHAVGSLFLEKSSDARRHKHKQADRWRNAGGKNGLLVRQVPPHVVGGAPGLELARRRGFVHRAAAPKLKYVQFELKRMGASPTPDSSTNTFVLEKLLLYQVVCEAEGDTAPRAGSGRSSNPAAARQAAAALRVPRRGARSPDSPDELSETESSGTESPVGPIPPGGTKF